MNSSTQHSKELQVLTRIIVRLYAMADTAECAAFAMPAVRFLVLWWLRIGQAVARDYAGGLAFDAGYQMHLPDQPNWQDSGPDDALRLAEQFRALAEILQFLSVYAGLGMTGETTPAPDLARRLGATMHKLAFAWSRIALADPQSSARGPPMLNRCRFHSPFSTSRWHHAPVVLLLGATPPTPSLSARRHKYRPLPPAVKNGRTLRRGQHPC